MYSDKEQPLQRIPECVHVYQANWALVDLPYSILFASPHQDKPLHLAAKECHVETVKYLVEMGANIHCKDSDGVSEWECTTDCESVD